MKHLISILLALAMLISLLTACGGQNTNAPALTDGIGNAQNEAAPEEPLVDELAALLDSANIEYTRSDVEEVRYDALSGVTLVPHTQQVRHSITIYTYADEAEAKTAAQSFQSDGTYVRTNADGSFGGASRENIHATIRIFQLGADVIRYVGTNEAVLALLTERLGEPVLDTSLYEEEVSDWSESTADWLASLLTVKGYTPEVQEQEMNPGYASDYANVIALEGLMDDIVVYTYADADTAAAVSACFGEDGSQFDDPAEGMSMIVDYIAPIHLYLFDNTIVLHCGTDEQVVALLTEALGQPFAGENDILQPVCEGALEAADLWGVTMEVTNVTGTGATLVLTQSGGEASGELQAGPDYRIERLEDDEWVSMDFDEVCWEDIAYRIEKDGTLELDVDWSFRYGELEAGTYRMSKQVMDFRGTGDYDWAKVYALFDVQ